MELTLPHLLVVWLFLFTVESHGEQERQRTFHLDHDTSQLMGSAGTGEGGALYPTGPAGQKLIDYVANHWEELLDNIEDVPSYARSPRSAVMWVGSAAENLPPTDYLNFLDHYLTICGERRVDAEVLGLQLMGQNRKQFFLMVNYEHERVRTILHRAQHLIPQENRSLHDLIDKTLAGNLADTYFANAGDDTPLPETLPGIKLRPPFASLIAKRERDERRAEGLGSSNTPNGMTKSDTNMTEEPGSETASGTNWFLGAALAVLALGCWTLLAAKRRRMDDLK